MLKILNEKIEKYDNIIIHRHSRPDLDALGSQLGLKQAILNTYPNKCVYAVGDVNKFSFLGEMDEVSDDLYKKALVIITDVAIGKMVSDSRYLNALEVIVVDHHKNGCDIDNAISLIDSSYPAVCELIADFLFANSYVVDVKCATYLMAGIITDTGRFQYSGNRANSLLIGSKLLECGADATYLYNKIYTESLESFKMRNYFASKFEVTPFGVAYLKNDIDVFDKFKVDFFTISRGMVNVMAKIDEISIWANFTVNTVENTIVGEFRSREFVIVDIAKKYGGGGHDLACGATLHSWDEVDLVISDFNNLLKNN